MTNQSTRREKEISEKLGSIVSGSDSAALLKVLPQFVAWALITEQGGTLMPEKLNKSFEQFVTTTEFFIDKALSTLSETQANNPKRPIN